MECAFRPLLRPATRQYPNAFDEACPGQPNFLA